jgi:hypothetical protein
MRTESSRSAEVPLAEGRGVRPPHVKLDQVSEQPSARLARRDDVVPPARPSSSRVDVGTPSPDRARPAMERP